MDDQRPGRVLRFAVTGALLGGGIATGCASQKHTVNQAPMEEPPHVNQAPMDEPADDDAPADEIVNTAPTPDDGAADDMTTEPAAEDGDGE